MLERKTSAIIFTVSISVLSGIFLWHVDSQNAFAFEENILALQTGIISTSSQDYALSQEFDAKIFQDGRILRLSGITTTGEQYYLYQKIIGENTIVKGKIFANNVFAPIIFNESSEQKTQQSDTELIMAVKLSDYTYSNYNFVISVKVFDATINPNARYDSRIGILEDVSVKVTITDRFDNQVTTLSGNTDSNGIFQDKYFVDEDFVDQGEYSVNVLIDDGNTNTNESFTTFFRGDIRDYFADDPNP